MNVPLHFIKYNVFLQLVFINKKTSHTLLLVRDLFAAYAVGPLGGI